MKKSAPLLAAGFVVLGGVYLAVRSRASSPAAPLPPWSCNHVTPPVHDVPAGVARPGWLRGFRAALERYVADNRVPLTWTYFAVQNALEPAERGALSCFSQEIKKAPGPFPTLKAAPGSVRTIEARLTWHLGSDGKRAVVSGFELAGPGKGRRIWPGRCGPAASSTCPAASFSPVRPDQSDFVRWSGVFPFHRKLRFSTQSTVPPG